MAFDNQVRGITLRNYVIAVEKRPVTGGFEQVEHIFFVTTEGTVVDVQPQKGVVKKICVNKVPTSTPSIAYAWGNNRFYIGDGGAYQKNETIYEYDPVNLKVEEVWDAQQYLPQYTNSFTETQYWGGWNNRFISTDGHAYGAAYRYRDIPAIWRINSGTGEVDIYHQNPDIKTTVEQGVYHSFGFYYTGAVTALHGVYASFLLSDSYEILFDTVIAEAGLAGVTFKPDSYLFTLHTDDRAVSSAKRRVKAFTNISGVDSPGIYVDRMVDLKNISDRTINLVGGVYQYLSALSGVTGINAPNFDLSLFYTNESRQVGRFMYASYYRGAAPNFYGFAFALQDYPAQGLQAGQMIFPTNQTWDRDSDLPDYAGYSAGVFKCNFGGNLGFSSSDEYVMFIYSYANGTTKGFIRPDNLEFHAYDPITDPDGYIIAQLTSAADYLNEFGCYLSAGHDSEEYNGETVVTDDFVTSSLLSEFETTVDENFDIADVMLYFHPDKNTTSILRSGEVRGVAVSPGIVAGVVELSANQLIIGGINYAGIVVKTRSGGVLTPVAFYGDINSIYGVLRFDANTSLWLGYSNQVVKISSLPSLTTININNIRYIFYGAKLNSTFAIISGKSIRVEDYYNSYAYVSYLNPSTGVNALLPNTPNKINPLSGKTFRELIGLTSESYTDSQAMTIANNYANANGLTMQDVVDMALDTCLYSAYDPTCWDNSKCIVGLRVNQLSGMTGIRLNDEADQSGTWYDEDYYLTIEYPAIYYFDKTDPATLTASDYKIIKFQVSGFQGVDTLGRVAISDDYVAFLKNDSPAGNAVVRVVTKAAIENAAATGNPITNFERTINISLGSTSADYGFGTGNGTFGLLSQYARPNNCFFSIGNKLYVSVITALTSGGSKPAIYEIDLTNGNTVIYARLNTDTAKALNYNPDTDTCFVSVGTDFYAIDNFTGISVPYDII